MTLHSWRVYRRALHYAERFCRVGSGERAFQLVQEGFKIFHLGLTAHKKRYTLVHLRPHAKAG